MDSSSPSPSRPISTSRPLIRVPLTLPQVEDHDLTAVLGQAAMDPRDPDRDVRPFFQRDQLSGVADSSCPDRFA
jgi:hypothetical protein